MENHWEEEGCTKSKNDCPKMFKKLGKKQSYPKERAW